MISPKKLIRMARKWQKVAALVRKRISLQRINRGANSDSCSTSTMADKGHLVVYSSDSRRFAIPLAYLDSEIFRELFQMSEEEFGSLEYKVQAPSSCHVIQRLWIMSSHSPVEETRKIWREL